MQTAGSLIPLAAVAAASGMRVNRIEKLIMDGKFHPENKTAQGVARAWTELDVVRLAIIGAMADLADFGEIRGVLKSLEDGRHLDREEPVFVILSGPRNSPQRRVIVCLDYGPDGLMQQFQNAINTEDSGTGVHGPSLAIVWLTKVAGFALLRLHAELDRRAEMEAQRESCRAAIEAEG